MKELWISGSRHSFDLERLKLAASDGSSWICSIQEYRGDGSWNPRDVYIIADSEGEAKLAADVILNEMAAIPYNGCVVYAPGCCLVS